MPRQYCAAQGVLHARPTVPIRTGKSEEPIPHAASKTPLEDQMEESEGSEEALSLVSTMAQNDDVDTVNTRIQDFH
jgi:hypothetical protein